MPTLAEPGLALLAGAGDHGRLLLALFIVLLAAKLMAELFERLRQPAVVGEILAGVIIGPSLLGLVSMTDPTGAMSSVGVMIEALAEIGVIFLLFTVGLETRPSDIFNVGGTATFVAILGVAVPFVAGWALLSFWPGHSWIEAIFLGAAMVATSVGITARVLSSMGLISAQASRVILAAAVIDDVIGLLVLAVVSSLARGEVDYVEIALIAALAIGFTVLMIAFGSRAIKKIKQPVINLKIGHSMLIFALVFCFGLAALANLIGIAGIVGAFLAGVALSEATDGNELHHQSQTLTEFTAPFFLVNIGLKLNLGIFLTREVVILSIIVTVLAVLTKLIGCSIPALGMGRRKALQVGVGMVPRGEVGIVVAQIGLTMSAVGDVVYGIVLAMAVATTLIAPPFIKLAFAGEEPAGPSPEYAEELQYDIR
ncbi:MAG TPA: cation:proton antiporter [Blastocatellia bacterium]|nr:cation:proton antiporter [Blastocatellia bacterium]